MTERSNIGVVCIFTMAILMMSVAAHGQEQSSGVVTLRIGQYENIHSKVLSEERTLLVFLPDDYETSSKRYPVLYVLDGEGTHRFIQSIAAITFYSGMRQLPKMIIVGILYFVIAGRFVLPTVKTEGVEATSAQDYFKETYSRRKKRYC